MAGANKAAKARPGQSAKTAGLMVPEECSRFVQQLVVEALPLICESLLGKAKEGDSTALKTLWQMAGLGRAATLGEGSMDEDADRRGAAFAREALKRFGQKQKQLVSDASR